jgi:hypothetical protein
VADKPRVDVDEEPEAQVLPERELMQLVAPEVSPEDIPVAQAEKPPDDAVEG